jgi:hypothetical protein
LFIVIGVFKWLDRTSRWTSVAHSYHKNFKRLNRKTDDIAGDSLDHA